ncbi:hypothetical protein L228DRAFT_284215 [Xylona heveae TC161]|uniref:CUE domain-containing protein n=1 Tax=Xylona heveae (strain CBS 132557 / TC161) TaxID=1328760 RepID=A0A165FM79_XYLHT|nr:hypothetical protein L228DRAFT_284215 [Xylona heveae TC161]KZF21146.1 hypothetical protein L228DRAFT_284215 [Xylona heveae TC161]
MPDVQSRQAAPRGRSSARGGRGGFGSRGGIRGSSRHLNGEKADNAQPELDDLDAETELLKKQYSTKFTTMKEMFPNEADGLIVFALQETYGEPQSGKEWDPEATIELVMKGVSAWEKVGKKSKDKTQSKPKEEITPTNEAIPSTRGSRGRGGFEGSRGGRGRPAERGRGVSRAGRGGSAAPPNGIRHPANKKDAIESINDSSKLSIPTEEASAWDVTTAKPGSAGTGKEQAAVSASGAPAGLEAQKVAEPPKKSWASTLFAKPAPPAPAQAPLKTQPAPAPKETAPEPPAAAEPTEKPAEAPERPLQQTQPQNEPSQPAEPVPTGTSGLAPSEPPQPEPTPNIEPSKLQLTETNLEQVQDVSAPAPTATAASTAASSVDLRSAIGSVTPATASQQPSARLPLGGFATSALKATATPRTSSFQRRVAEQQEAVVMPGNHAVDRAAVQFGSLGLNGSVDELDVDEDREEAETRAQPPQHSPVAHPVTSLPPAPKQQTTEQAPHELPQTSRPAPGLPPVSQPHQSPQVPLAAQTMTQQGSQGGQAFNRFGQPPVPQEPAAPVQKPYDPFGQHSTQTQYDAYPVHTQPQAQPHQPAPTTLGGFSSAPGDYSAYYTTDHQRNAYQNYYNAAYGQQAPQAQQDASSTQQRSGSGFGLGPADTTPQYLAGQTQQPQSRYGQPAETQTSGHTTPNPSLPVTAQPALPTQQAQHIAAQPHAQAAAHTAGYPYGHPYYSSPYYAAYLNQFGYGGHYGAPFGTKSAMYGQPHSAYGMSPQTSYEHSSSPANLGGFGQPSLQGRDTSIGGLGDYGRTGSSQASQAQPLSGSTGAFGSVPDVFGRSGAGFPAQTQTIGQQNVQQSADEPLKPFGESKATGGPSPSLTQPGRPGSATAHTPTQPTQSAFPLPQSQQSQHAFGGYPSHLNHNIHGSQGGQYGGLGGLGGHQGAGQSHGATGYGAYGAGFGNYYGNSGRGGWGGNYGH